jgi:hypothetical protein
MGIVKHAVREGRISALDLFRGYSQIPRRLMLVEDGLFTECARKHFKSEDEIEDFKTAVAEELHRGKRIKGTTHLFKIRMALGGRGKKGGSRVIYYFHRDEYVYFLFIYSKSELSDISPSLRKELDLRAIAYERGY